MTTVWQAAPGTDLLSRDGTRTRAYFEAAFIALWRGTGDSFPGFSEFARGSKHPVIAADSPRDVAQAGTRRMLLVSISVTDDELTSVVCDDRAGLYRPEAVEWRAEHGPKSGTGPDGAVLMFEPDAWKVTMRKVGPEPRWPEVVDRDPDRAPNWNAFGGWALVDQEPGWEDDAFCKDWGIRNYPGVLHTSGAKTLRLFPDYYPDPVFQPTLPQSPGWTQIGRP